MEWLESIGELNWVAVVLATLSTFVVGSIWYSMGFYGKKWSKLVGLSEKDMKNGEGMGEVFVMTAIGSFIASVVMGLLMIATATESFSEGLVFGIVVGIAFRFSSHVMHNGFARRSKDLTLIDGMHDVVALGIIGGILGVL